eukprot:Clim_evm4s147 gene=Clim_evmTU4s147
MSSTAEAEDVVDISYVDMLIPISLIVVNAGFHWCIGSGVEQLVLIGGIRAFVQVTVLGLVLEYVLEAEYWWLTILISIGLTLLAAREAWARPMFSYDGMYWHQLVALTAACYPFTFLAVGGILRVEPIYSPRYFIPLFGMLLGAGLNGISLALSTALRLIDSQKSSIEYRLSMGANRRETFRPVFMESIRTGMLPSLNQMNVIGLISIPGMMTGQILGGSDPSVAGRYQIMITFLISITITTAVCISMLFVMYEVLVKDSQTGLLYLDITKLKKRKSKAKDIVMSFFSGVAVCVNPKKKSEGGKGSKTLPSTGKNAKPAASKQSQIEVITEQTVIATDNPDSTTSSVATAEPIIVEARK